MKTFIVAVAAIEVLIFVSYFIYTNRVKSNKHENIRNLRCVLYNLKKIAEGSDNPVTMLILCHNYAYFSQKVEDRYQVKAEKMLEKLRRKRGEVKDVLRS